MQISIRKLSQIVEGVFLTDNQSGKVARFSLDSRRIQKNEFFIALRGERFDGHDFIKEAFKKGASGVIVSQKINPSPFKDKVVIKVSDTTQALARVASFYLKKIAPVVIGITGSSGKTTTKEILKEILAQKFSVLGSEKSFNNSIGIPLTLLKLKPKHRIVILEYGVNHPGEMTTLTEIAAPNIGIITTIGPSHLEFFHTERRVAQEKLTLLKSLQPPFEHSILNIDNRWLKKAVEKKSRKNVLTFGLKNKADFQAEIIEEKPLVGIKFRVNKKDNFYLPLPGVHNVYNALAGISCGKLLGLDTSMIQSALSSLSPPSMRSEIITLKHKIKIINDAYNANPQSMKEAFRVLKKAPGVKIAILGDMLELGEKSKVFHGRLGQEVARLGIDFLVTIGKNAVEIARAARKAGMKKVTHFNNKEGVSEYLISLLQGGETLLFKASRRMKLEEIINKVKKRVA